MNDRTGKIFFILLGALSLILAGSCLAQEGANKELLMAGHGFISSQPAPPLPLRHVYEEVRIHEFIDTDNADMTNPVFIVRPSGLSVLSQVEIGDDWAGNDGHMRFQPATSTGRLMGDPNGAQVQFFNFNENTTVPSAYVHSIDVTGRIAMGALDATQMVGKNVYDVAEAIRTVDAGPADVVSISPDEDLTVRKSTRAYDPAVAGVISTDPKLYLGSNMTDKQPLALAGVVPCKVSAENGPIQPGDMLVSASLAGHAMRADADSVYPGMLVGTALEVLAEETGTITILISQ